MSLPRHLSTPHRSLGIFSCRVLRVVAFYELMKSCMVDVLTPPSHPWQTKILDMSFRQKQAQPYYTLNPTPYTPHPTPYTLHPTPCTLHPTPYVLVLPTPCTLLHPVPHTLHPPFERIKSGPLRAVHVSRYKWPTLSLAPEKAATQHAPPWRQPRGKS